MKLQNDLLIKKWEELRLKAYLPTPQDVWTIGWGHTRTAKQGMTITLPQAEALFEKDTAWAQNAVNTRVKVPLSQHQFDALVSLVFNIGEGAFAKSTLLRKLNAKDYEGAAQQFLVWNKQKGKTLKGLVRRRAEEMGYFLGEVATGGRHADAPKELKPMATSKEALGGLLVTLLSSSAVAVPEFIEGHQALFYGSLVAIGVGIVANRVWARMKGQR